MKQSQHIGIIFAKLSKYTLLSFGTVFLIMLLLSFTSIPFWAYYNLGTKNAQLKAEPNYIIQLSGSGMPSPDGLIRTYYTAKAANKYTDAKIIVAHPVNIDNNTDSYFIRKELTQRGVDSARIFFEPTGFNTYSQAKKISSVLSNKDSLNLLIITSPEHLYRAIKTLKKLGFNNVGGKASFEKNLEEKMLSPKDIKSIKNLNLRYNMWTYLKYEITVAREYVAIAYYKFRGWI